MRLGFSEPVPGLDSQKDKACAGCHMCVVQWQWVLTSGREGPET